MALTMQDLLSRAAKDLSEGKLVSSKTILLQALNMDPCSIAVKELLAYVYGRQGDLKIAELLLKEVVEEPQAPLSALYEYGSLLLDEFPEAAIRPLERALQIEPNSFEVLHDLATAYARVGRRKEAIEKYFAASAINNNSSELFYNIGRLFDEVFDHGKANEFYKKSLAIDPTFVGAQTNFGLNLCRAGLQEEGIHLLESALRIQPNIDYIFGDLMHAKMQIADWEDYDLKIKIIKNGINGGQKITHPFVLLGLVDEPELHMHASKIYAESALVGTPDYFQFSRKKSSKIKLGYFSADFRNHAIANLTAELFELHDHSAFEIYAFSFGPKVEDEQRQRLRGAFHEFIEIFELPDCEVINLVRSKGIDIAIDLGGYTENSPVSILKQRVAPIQVGYLGYLGTLGAPHMDYILADHEVIPDQYQKCFQEKIAYIPNCFQICDRQRAISEKGITRTEFGLPEKAFIFCNFNNSYKITPNVFSSWCHILQRVHGSVLWLFESNKNIAKNLSREAEHHGVSASRLIFSGVLPIPEYLARYKLADLFLDTFPYNAGTTASDALWAGLPVLTRSGKSFPSRMAGSILKAIDAPELVTCSIEHYEDLAVELATNRSKLKSIREKIETNKMSAPLFNSPKTTKNIERAYQKMHLRYLNGMDPENIDIV
jgi:predicted O-linked N-acetylglucosamine transferase (SPINDLY family)